MKYGVFSDVHGNYVALKAVLDFYKRNGVENFICCGDIVGYGPQPLECAEALRGLKNLITVMGNHDAALVGKMDLKWFNPNAAWAIEFARGKFTGQAMDFLSRLPERIETKDFTVVHGSPRKPLTEYLLSEGQFTDNAGNWTVSPCFIGHSHMPLYFSEGENGIPETDFIKPLVKIFVKGKLMLNPGSVGQPRDGDTRAACGIYDSDKKYFELYRVFYNVETVQKMMEVLKMPGILSERLSFGF
ncbi:MAG: metallophosphoesterase family protein [Elusimicrobiota bacterium]|nr:metallophosphoesterase family protein [Elusimicrobiota bacterium]